MYRKHLRACCILLLSVLEILNVLEPRENLKDGLLNLELISSVSTQASYFYYLDH